MTNRLAATLASLAGAAFIGAVTAHPGCIPDAPEDTFQTVAVENTGLPDVLTKRGFMDAVRRGEQNVFPLFAACYDADNPPRDEIIAHIEQTIYGLGQRYFLGSRWSGTQGTPITLLWSLVPDGLSIPSGVGEGVGNSELFSRMDTLFATQGGRATWIARMQMCYDRWQELSGITFVRVTVGGNDWDDGASWGSSGAAGLRGNMRVAMKVIDGGGGILAYNFFPGSGNGGNMVLDRSESWNSSANTHRFMRNIFMHELGHGIGIQHVCPANSTKLLEPFVSTSYDGVRHDDIRAVQRHYGDIFENNASTATAYNFGTLTDGQLLAPCTVPGLAIPSGSTCSVSNTSDNDYYRFDLLATSNISVLLNPVGLNYDSSTQAGNGSCNSGNFINSLAICDLGLQLYNSGGGLIATANNTGAGFSESLMIELAAGTYYLRVYNAGAGIASSQLYNFTVGVEEVDMPCPGDVNGDGVVDFTDFSIVAQQYGQCGPGWSGDIDGSGCVDFGDISLVLGNYGNDCN